MAAPTDPKESPAESPEAGTKRKAQDGKPAKVPGKRRRKAVEPAPGRRPAWLKGWWGVAVVAACGLAVLSFGYAVFVSVSNGTLVELEVHVGQRPDGSAYLRCGPATTAGVCTSATDNATFTVHARDRVHVTFVNDDGTDTVFDVRLDGGPYQIWPAGFAVRLEGCKAGTPCAEESFTAWASGTFRIACAIEGRPGQGAEGTLVVL